MSGKMLANLAWYGKLRIGIASIELFGKARFLGAERFTMGFARILFVRRPVADMAAHDHQRRFVRCRKKLLLCVGQRIQGVRIGNAYERSEEHTSDLQYL